MLNPTRWFPVLFLSALLAVSGAGCTKEIRKNRHLARANASYQAQKYDEAEIEYLKVLQVAPENSEAIRQLGFIYSDEGKLIRAYTFLTRAAQLEPNNAQVHLKLALAALALGDYKKATDESSLALAKEPGLTDAFEVLANSAVTVKGIEDANQKINKMRQSGPDRAGYHIAAGTFYFRQQDLTNAETEFKKAIEMEPKSPTGYGALGALDWARNDAVNADQALKTAADLSPIRSAQRTKYAEFKVRTGKMDEGRRIAEDITQQAPDYLPAWNFLALMAFGDKKYDECKTLIQRVLARDPYNFEAAMLSGNVSMLQGNSTNALATFKAMSNIYPHSPQVNLQLGRSYLMLGDSAKAITALQQAVADNPQYADAVLLLASLNIRKGEVPAAISSLSQLTKQQPQIPQGHLLLIEAYIAQKNLDQALAVARHMSEIFSKSSDVPLVIGSILIRQQKFDEARQSFEKALAMSPDNLAAVEQIVGLDIAEKKYSAATDRLNPLVEKMPKSTGPLLLLARVHLSKADDIMRAELQKRGQSPGVTLRLGDVPAAQPEVDQAEAELLKAIEIEPTQHNAYLSLAQMYVASGKQQQALDRLNGLLAKTNDVSAFMEVAMLHESMTNYSAARDSYEKVLSAYPDTVVALNNLAGLYYDHLGDPAKGLSMAEKAQQLAPQAGSVEDTLGWMLSRRGEYLRAINLLKDSAAKIPSDFEVQAHLGITHYMVGEQAPARAALQAAMQSPRPFASKEQAARCLAILSIDPKTADAAAVSLLQSELHDSPRDSIALEKMGAIQERDGAPDKAVETYQEALKYAPQNAGVNFRLAELYAAPPLNNPQKAAGFAKTAHELAPDNARISAVLGRLVNLTSGDPKWAGSLLEDSARKLPGDPQVAYDLAWTYYSMGRVQDAQAQMQVAAKAGPGFAKAADATRFLSMVAAASDASQAAAAAPEAQKILTADPAYVPALMVSALVLESQAKYDLAAQTYNQVLARYPLFTPATRNLGLLYFSHLNDDQKALDLTAKARDAYPQDPDIAKALGVLSYRKGNYPKAAQLLKESALARKNDAELLYYLGMAQYQLKAKAESKATLQQAVSLNLQAKLAEDARRVLAELK